MPKSVETEDESSRIKICNKINKLHRLDPLMKKKRNVRPLFTLLLLTFFAATFVSRTFFHRTTLPTIASIKLIAIPNQTLNKAHTFNHTLLRLASVDLSEEKTRQEVSQLLDGDMDSIGRYRAFNTWKRFSHSHRDIKARRNSNSNAMILLRSPNFYRHWLGFRRALRDWWRNKRFQPEVMFELTRLLNNSKDNDRRKFGSCAVVGNSGILLNTEFGGLIDSHEVVIRLNNARTVGYETRVGSKTSFSFINSNVLHQCSRRDGCFCHPYGEKVPIVMYICQALHFLDYTVCNASHETPIIVTDLRFDLLCSRVVKYYSMKRWCRVDKRARTSWGSEHGGALFHYSSGMQAVMLAIGVCERVGLFGFGKSGLAKHHYHTNQRAELRLHDYEAEYDLYRDLAERPEEVPFLPRSFAVPPVTLYH